MNEVAYLILTRDRKDYLSEVVDSVHRNAGMPCDLFVVDNGSADGTADWLRGAKSGGRIKDYFLNQSNLGISIGRNVGISLIKCHGKYERIIYSGNDLIMEQPGSLLKMYEASLKLPDYLLAGWYEPCDTKRPTNDRDVEGFRIGETGMIAGVTIYPKDFWDKFYGPEKGYLASLVDIEACIYANRWGYKTAFLKDVVFHHKVEELNTRFKDYHLRKKKEEKTRFENKNDVFWDGEYQKEYENYESVYANYKKCHWSKAQRIQPLLEAGKILDVGCGLGNMARLIAEVSGRFACWGCDNSQVAVQNCILLNKNFPGNITPFYSHAYKIDCPDKSFDGVLATEIIEHLPDPLRFLLEANRVLKDGGHILATVPAFKSPTSDRPDHFRRYTPEDFADAVGLVFLVEHAEEFGNTLIVKGRKR